MAALHGIEEATAGNGKLFPTMMVLKTVVLQRATVIFVPMTVQRFFGTPTRQASTRLSLVLILVIGLNSVIGTTW
jgi:hypothetical protein